MIEGKWDAANKDKELLEATQRDRRKEIVKSFQETGVPCGPSLDERRGITSIGEEWWVPRWFVRELDQVKFLIYA